jgi:hypothetical protein
MMIFDQAGISLVPFSPRLMLSAACTAVVITAAVVMACWPHQPLAAYVTANDLPLAFFAAFSVSLIIQSYLNLRWGRGEMIEKDDYFHRKEDLSAPKRPVDFIPRGLTACAIHTALLASPFLPMLILGAALSGVSLQAFTQALAVVVATSLLCRLAGVMVFLGQGKRSSLGYMASRCLLTAVVFGTLLFAPTINPIHILYRLQFDPDNLVKHSGYLYAAGVAPAIFCLAIVNHWLAGRHPREEAQR